MRAIPGLATLLSVLCLATVASAHAVLVSTEPADGSIQAQAPKQIELRFNEAVAPVVVGVIDAAGARRDDVRVSAVGDNVVIDLPDNLPRGTQVVSFRVISEDGHPVAGSMVFSIGAVTGSSAKSAGAGPVNSLIWLARAGVYFGLFAGVGGAFFACWIAFVRTSSRLTVTALVSGLVSAVASLGLQGLDLLDLPPGGLVAAVPWRAAVSTSQFHSLLIAAVAMTVAIVALRSKGVGSARMLSALALVGVGLSLASSGHAASASPHWLTRPAVFLHGVSVAFWVGALAPLAAMAWRRTEGLLTTLLRFSRVAAPSVVALVLTGLVLAIVQLGSLGGLVDTRYGVILSIKLALAAILLGLAVLNRFRRLPALALDPQNTRPLLRLILAECVVVAGILAVVAGWRFTPPPRALAAATVSPLAIQIRADNAMVQVQVSPGKVGVDSFELRMMNGEGSPLPAREATLTLSLPARGIEPFERKAVPGADGNWSIRDVPLPVAGRWHLRIDALVTDFERITLRGEFEVPPR